MATEERTIRVTKKVRVCDRCGAHTSTMFLDVNLRLQGTFSIDGSRDEGSDAEFTGDLCLRCAWMVMNSVTSAS